MIATETPPRVARPRLWMPERVVFTRAAWDEPFGQSVRARVEALGLPVDVLRGNRLPSLRGDDERSTYRRAKRTLAVVTAPPGAMALRPIPPSADYQFHLAEGCPAHCQYCYLAGSLAGPPVVRAFANLPAILENTRRFERPGVVTSYEASCYTDPLGIEHLTGSLAECIRHFGGRDGAHLRWVSKYSAVEPLLDLPHGGRTRCRLSVNASEIARRHELGVAPVADRLAALRRLAMPRDLGGGGYPVGLVIAPIMPIAGWREHYAALLDQAAAALDFPCDLTFELITHRFTAASKTVLEGWYPGSDLEMDEASRSAKRGKFGGAKYVYPRGVMAELKAFFRAEIAARFPDARVLYWT